MDKESINKIAKMCIELCLDDGFYFTVCKNDNNNIEYSVGVKMIQEFSSLLILVGNSGGGFNRVFLANEGMVNRETLMMKWITEELTEEFSEYKFAGLEIEYMPNRYDFKNKSMVLKTINCDGNIETRKYNTVNDFINHVDSKNAESAFTAPMLDDEIDTILIDEIEISMIDLKTLNDFYNKIKFL